MRDLDVMMPLGGRLIERRYKDDVSDVILVELDGRRDTQYVTWRQNRSDGSCHLGHYTDDENSARSDFRTR